ncbi:MAG: DUF748 domain-containing protein [Syntrophales bacterium]|nr:DUF748 domain-containing protein [Syntrophales bacterium]MCK9528113.1 DUF748 domain-containing protein [Syntrophales bacterium]MDX9921082.1 DUF748 domain-containing protein [Syntrophales bacterium]
MAETAKKGAVTVLKRKSVAIGACVILFYTLAGFLLVPFLIGHYLPGVLGERFDAVVSMEKVRINPYSLTVEVEKFRISEPSGAHLAGFERLHVNFQLSSLFRWALTFRDVILDGPSLNIVIDGEGNLNFARLAGAGAEFLEPAPAEQPERVEETSAPPRLVVFNTEINDARIDVTDQRQPVPATASFYPLTVHLADISTLPEREGDYTLVATGADGTVLEWSGRVTMRPLRSRGSLAFRNIPLETPWTFFSSMVNMLPPEGDLSVEARYSLDLGTDTTVAVLQDLRLRLRELGLRTDDGTDGVFLRLPELDLDVEAVDIPGGRADTCALALSGLSLGFSGTARPAFELGRTVLKGGTFDLPSHSVTVEYLDLAEGIIDVIRDGEGTVNLVRLLDAPGGILNVSTAGSEESADGGEPWNVFLESLSLRGFRTHVTDSAVRPDSTIVDIDDITLTLSDFDGRSPFPFEASLELLQGGSVTVSGTFEPDSMTLESEMAVRDLSLPVIAPYLAQVADLTLASGRLSTGGTMRRDGTGALAYRGQIDIADLKVIENTSRDILVGWNRFRVPDLRISLDPDGLEADTVSLSGLTGKLIISEEGKVSAVEAFRSGDGPPEEEAPGKQPAVSEPGKPFPVTIGRVTLDKGMLHFADFSLRPQFETRIHELKGVITGVSSTPGTRSRVELDGRVDRYGSSRITGETNFFDPREFTDIVMVFKNLEMPSLTPYSGKFAGRRIDDGRLSLDLAYRIENSRLASDNTVVIESLVLGDRVESPDAVNLPLGLAVALLKDADGVIHIGLPVTGSLDDPEFRIGPLILQVFVNVITKVVTSPFRALGALIGGDEEALNRVLFEPGSMSIPPGEEERLDGLLKALRQRPQLKLVVTGRYDAAHDGIALKDRRIRTACAELSGITLEPGEEPGPPDFSNPEAQNRLASLFVERYGKDEYEQVRTAMAVDEGKQAEGQKKKAAPVTIEPADVSRSIFAALVEREVLDSGSLEDLADGRAAAVAAHLAGPEGLDPARISVMPSEATGEGDPLSVLLDLAVLEQ